MIRCDSEGIPCIVQKITFDGDSFLCVLFNGMYNRVPANMLHTIDEPGNIDRVYEEVEEHSINFYHYITNRARIVDKFRKS